MRVSDRDRRRIATLAAVLAFAAACSNRRTAVPGPLCLVSGEPCAEADSQQDDGGPGALNAALPPDAGPDPAPPLGPCGVPEFEPNDTVDTATVYAIGTSLVGCIAAYGDEDVYELTAPSGDRSGGYFTGSVTQDEGFMAHVIVRNINNRTFRNIFTPDATAIGKPIYFYWTTAPGQTYHLRIAAQDVVGTLARSQYTLKVDYTKVDDPAEPNDTLDDAYPITLGAPIDAYYFAGYKNGITVPTDLFDYYSIQVPVAGPATVQVESVASKLTVSALVYGPGNMVIASLDAQNQGDPLSMPVTLQADTPYKIQVKAAKGWAPPNDTTETWEPVPDVFTTPYRLTVTQP
ncbi:MAG TPA: hypothetical protein VGP91_09725 [Actinoplanes sp.]|nr:hypothetical protein [Actinoplanes sp.]